MRPCRTVRRIQGDEHNAVVVGATDSNNEYDPIKVVVPTSPEAVALW